MKSIFLLGSERSGSNLLRTLLGNHSSISAPIAPHFCDVFIKMFHNYLSLNNDNQNNIIKDLETYVNHQFNDWKIKLSPEKYNNCQSFIDFMHVVYSEKAENEGKENYFSKDNHNHRYALGILKDIPNAKFIYLYRDPRDQVASWLRTPVHLHTPYAAIKKWNDEQNEIFKLKSFYNVDFFPVKYENLVDDSEAVMTGLLKYLGLEVEEACFETKKDNKEAEKHPLWGNLNKPVKKSNYGKYHDVLKGKDLLLVETIAKESMIRLGYSFETPANWEKGNRYVFSIKEKIRKRSSKKKNKSFIDKEMAVLKDKGKLIKTIFNKFEK